MNSEYRKGKQSFSILDQTEIARNVADRVDEDGVRDYGILELLSQIAMNTRLPGAEFETIMVSGTGAVNMKRAIFCPGGSRIHITAIALYIETGSDTLLVTDQNGNKIFPNLKYAMAIVGGAWGKYFLMPTGASLFITTTTATSWDLSLSYSIIPVIA